MLDIIKSGIAVGKFSEVHEEDFAKLLDNLHRLYMDIFEKRGQELLRAAIQAELTVVHLLPESGGRLPDGTKVILQELKSRADLNGKRGTIMGWDYALQRYTVEIDKEEGAGKRQAIQNPDMLGIGDLEDQDDDDEEEQNQMALAIPKKLMLVPKNALVDLAPPARKLEDMVKNWNSWRARPRSVSASQDADAVHGEPPAGRGFRRGRRLRGRQGRHRPHSVRGARGAAGGPQSGGQAAGRRASGAAGAAPPERAAGAGGDRGADRRGLPGPEGGRGGGRHGARAAEEAGGEEEEVEVAVQEAKAQALDKFILVLWQEEKEEKGL